ncbi:RloB family protein [Paenibacillus sp. MMS20-IR301]|uniref:RloB family protein n=1 Tax=Paenibacillus sp. MMS20-IR301 TaxID=2895946 RepID=UPI0028E21CCF|nr:RloB family protein [Paenibacillus sp. MMS20-IR301]WNS41579.1 RloB family protein [Paenibacillus sp. MMS20-IR301]
MTFRKQTLRYFFSVEGETEDLYLKRLQTLINSEPSANYKVSLDSKVEKDPVKRAKSINITGKTKITHWYDYESNQPVHTTQFQTMIDRLRQTEKLGKQINYSLGYSNFTFELWIILHKNDSNRPYQDRSQYLQPINSAYAEQFANLDTYKQKDNFNRVLGKISLQDVKMAVTRAKKIMENNVGNGYQELQYKKYTFYRENPSLTIWESVDQILEDCGLN